jgi:hypothetical protein
VPIKLLVSGSSKQSRIALVGQTGKELLASAVFTEPRAKGATLRALKKILGADVIIEDSTTSNRQPVKVVAPVPTATPKKSDAVGKSVPKKTAAAARPRRQATAPAAKPPAAKKAAKRTTKSTSPV